MMRRHKNFPPMRDMLTRAEGTTRFHMPGHKGVLSPDDTTELVRTDDLYAPYAGIAEAEQLAAAACDAGHTIMLTGGSTAGLMAMILSTVAPGESIIMARNVHHAVLSACIWGGIDAIFAENIPEAVVNHPRARAVLLTHPDYYGNCVDVESMARLAHSSGMLVLVDEAHGAHFSWWLNPQSAGRLGADCWVQSAHKTLPALTGAAWLHLAPHMDAARARRFLRMVQTSSPPFPILESLDDARDWMDQHGISALDNLCAELASLRTKIAKVDGYENMHSDDPTRLVIGTRGRGYTGLEVQDLLSTHGIDVEMADEEKIVCICTVFDKPRAFARLLAGLKYIPAGEPLPPLAVTIPTPGKRMMSLREAALSPQEAVALKEAVGRTISVSAGMYPPGIPLILPGEQVTAACVEKLQSLPFEKRFGVENNCLICVK